MEKDIAVKRFKEIREDLQLTQIEFAKKIGVKKTTADIERGRTKLSGEVVKELLRQFSINPLWIYGESQQKYLNLSNVSTMPKVITTDISGNETMILVNQRAAAGYPQNVEDSAWQKQLPAFQFPLPEYRNATYRGFQVEGDSMQPNLFSGEWVLGKAVSNLDYITEGKIYVIVTIDSVLVKKVYKIPGISDKIRLVSINPDYSPFELDVKELQELWQVNSKLTFSLDANAENHLLTELKASMKELKKELQVFKRKA